MLIKAWSNQMFLVCEIEEIVKPNQTSAVASESKKTRSGLHVRPLLKYHPGFQSAIMMKLRLFVVCILSPAMFSVKHRLMPPLADKLHVLTLCLNDCGYFSFNFVFSYLLLLSYLPELDCWGMQLS